jgi:DNA mismatch repair protein MutL
MSIHLLPTEVAAKIAAGEVIERPASVVKELIENAIDAGATTIRVDLLEGGLRLIRVTDNGRGIPAEEVPLALARHATSKLEQLDDLERLQTLGFRGEALASIAAVSELTLTSRPAGSDLAASITVRNGAPGSVSSVGAAPGTTVMVRDLFASVPARRKFLKSQATETGHCLHLLQQYALAYPEIRFQVSSDGRAAISSAGDGNLYNALVLVYGLEVAEQMIAVQSQEPDRAPPLPAGMPALQAPPLTGRGAGGTNAPPAGMPALQTPPLSVHPQDSDPPRVSGYISRPTCYKSSRQYLSFFVNRRWVQSRTLSFAVEEAYHSLLLAGRHPIAVLNLTLDPALLDVNVHPAKTEVKFLRERQVYAALQRAVRAALLETSEAPHLAPRAFSPVTWPGAPATQPGEDAGDTNASAGSSAPEEAAESVPAATPGPAEPPPQPTFVQGPLWGPAPRQWPPRAEPQPPIPWERGERARGSAAGFSVPVPGAHEEFQQTGRLPPLRILGQLAQMFLITEGPDGMYLIDQHAAHERILLEEMVAAMQARTPITQLLLNPLPLECAPREREAIEDRLDALQAVGFALEPFGPTTLLVRGVPGPLARKASASTEELRELLLDLAGHRESYGGHSETWEEHALANVACKAAMKAGDALSLEEMRALIAQLEQVDARYHCCHGRPTMIHLSLSALERQFDRR